MSNELTEETIMEGVICRKCKATLAPHTIGEHLNPVFMATHHQCEANQAIERLVDAKRIRVELSKINNKLKN